GRMQTPHRRGDVAVSHRRDAVPGAALADGRGEHELERRAPAPARVTGAQVGVQLAEVQAGEHAVDRDVDLRLDEAVDAGDGLVMRLLARAEYRRARRRIER